MKKAKEVKTIYWYIEILEKLQKLRKENLNNQNLGYRIRKVLENLE